MSERRPHWTDDLIESVGYAMAGFDGEGNVVPGQTMTDRIYTAIAAVEDWHKAKRDSRVRTHSDECWRWHQECAEYLIENLTEERDALKHDYDKAEAQVQAVRDVLTIQVGMHPDRNDDACAGYRACQNDVLQALDGTQ